MPKPTAWRRAGVTALAAGLVLILGACSSEPEVSTEVRVLGEVGAAPELEYAVPLEVDEARAEVLWPGDGPALVEGQPVLLHFYAERGDDASVVGSTYEGEPKPFVLSEAALGVEIHAALSGRNAGARVLNVVPAGEGQEFPTVAVFDVLPTRAVGEPVRPRANLPTVRRDDAGVPTITVPDREPPADLEVQPLIKGTGSQVEPGQVVTVQYTGVAWSTGEVFDSTWTQNKLPLPIPIGSGSVMEGWDTGLVEQTVGSQVLLVVPPHLGYAGREGDELAEETLVFVVDVLDASGGPER